MSADGRAAARGEDGVALIGVLLAVIVLFGLALVFVATATFETRSTAGARDAETALHAAEGGIDDLIPSINGNPHFCSSADDPTVTACDEGGLIGTGHVRPAGMTAAEGRAWIRSVGEAADEDDLVRLADGEAFAIRPVDDADQQLDEIWAVGWVPSRASPERVRAIRIEFDLLRYNPQVGLLTGGNLAFGGSASVTGNFGSIHANGNANEHSNVGAFEVEKDVTVSGTITDTVCNNITFLSADSECRGGAARRALPHVNARDLYPLGRSDPDNWYDLCPGPRVTRWSQAGPCEGEELWAGSPNAFNGWKFEGPTGNRSYSRWKGINIHEGVYYVHHGNAYLQTTSGNNPRAVTVLASEVPPAFQGIIPVGGGSNSGHIQLAGGAQITSVLSSLALVADRDIVLAGGAEITGLVAAQEQFEVEGNVEIIGAVLIEDLKDTSGSWVQRPSKLHGNMNITYDGGLEVPLAGVIRIIAWNEL